MLGEGRVCRKGLGLRRRGVKSLACVMGFGWEVKP